LPSFTGQYCQTQVQTNPCLSNPCQNGGSCINQYNGQCTCQCPQCYSGQYCQVYNPCCNVHCQNGGTPLNTNGMCQCVCPSGYTGQYCQTKIQTNPCASNPCQNGGVCITGYNNQCTCQCPPSFTGQFCQSPVVIITTTQSYYNPCASNPCQNGGQCINQYNGQCTWYKILHLIIYLICFFIIHLRSSFNYSQCPAGYTGQYCQTPVIVTTTQGYYNPCASNPCQNGGQCINQYNGQCTW
jgi:hypothetical protein